MSHLYFLDMNKNGKTHETSKKQESRIIFLDFIYLITIIILIFKVSSIISHRR